jgi:hypothetical protein
VIVISCGRSGTVFVAKILERLGICMGLRQDPNAEAFHFIRLNTALMSMAGASLSDPEPLREKLEDERFRGRARAFAARRVRPPFGVTYLGWRTLTGRRSIVRQAEPWGWKDPRNTFTLPLWLDLFPEARVVHVVRHGADVAGSYWVKQDRPRRASFLLSAAQKRRFHLPTMAREASVWYRTRGDLARVKRFDSPDEALALWDLYVAEGRRQLGSLGERGFEVRFEDLMSEPVRQIRALAGFCEVPADATAVTELAASANPDRAYAHRGNPELVAVAAREAAILAKHGYPHEAGRAGASPVPE